MLENIQKVTIKIRYETVFLILLILPVLVDQLNGYLQVEYGVVISISQIFKFIYIIFFFFGSLLFFRFSRTVIVSILLLLCVPMFLNVFNERIVNLSFFADLVFVFKVLTFPVTFLFFYSGYKQRGWVIPAVFIKDSNKVIFFIIFIALTLSVFGFGQGMYDESGGISIGYKGYFIAGNELSSLFTVIYSFHLFSVVRKKNIYSILMTIIIAGICALLMSTKTTILSFILISIIIPLMNYIYNGGSIKVLIKKKWKLITGALFSVLICLTGVYFIFKQTVDAYISKLIFTFNKADAVLTFILSSRDKRYADSYRLFEEYSFIEKIFGTGWTYPQHHIGARFSGWGSAETDWLDMLVAHGFSGVIVVYLFWISVLVLSMIIFYKKKSEYSVPSCAAMLLLILNTTFSGHIIYSALIGMYLAFFVSFQFIIGVKE